VNQRFAKWREPAERSAAGKFSAILPPCCGRCLTNITAGLYEIADKNSRDRETLVRVETDCLEPPGCDTIPLKGLAYQQGPGINTDLNPSAEPGVAE